MGIATFFFVNSARKKIKNLENSAVVPYFHSNGSVLERDFLGRARRRWEGSIRMYLKEIGINTLNWVDSAQDIDYWRAFVNVAVNLRIP